MEKKSRKKEEHYLQSSIVEYFRYNNIFCFTVPNGIFFNEKNKMSQIKYMAYLKKEGFWPGVSDLILFPSNGKSIFLEVKLEKAKLNPKQKEFKEIVENLGYEYKIVKRFEDAQLIYEEIKRRII